MNLGMEPRELKADMVIGIYQPVEEDQIEASDVQAMSICCFYALKVFLCSIHSQSIIRILAWVYVFILFTVYCTHQHLEKIVEGKM